MIELDKIYNENCLEGMKRIDDGSVDCVVTSPPYDNLRMYGGVGDGWNYETFKAIAQQIVRVLKDGGVCVWNVNDQTENGSKTGNSFRQCLFFMESGLNLNDTMIWRKTNPMPQVRQPRYASCFEFMFVFSKGKPSTFNPIMRKTKCGGQNYDSTCKNMGGENGRTKKHFVINHETVEYNIWDIAIAQNKTGHPAVFPYELARRHILSWSEVGGGSSRSVPRQRHNRHRLHQGETPLHWLRDEQRLFRQGREAYQGRAGSTYTILNPFNP